MSPRTAVLYKMIRCGPYASADGEAQACGFCGNFSQAHTADCPWPRFRDELLTVYPEWAPDLNEYDQQERLDKEQLNAILACANHPGSGVCACARVPGGED